MALSAFGSTRPRRIRAAVLGLVLAGGLVAPGAVLAVGPSTTLVLAAGQTNPTNISPINFTVTFSDPVTGFTSSDVYLSPTAESAGGPPTATITDGAGDGSTFNVAITGMTTAGFVYVYIPGGVAKNPAGEPNRESQIAFTYWWPGPLAKIDLAGGQAKLTGTSPIRFTLSFSEPVTGFTSDDIKIRSSAGATTATVTVSGMRYNIAVTGMTTKGFVVVDIVSGAAKNVAGKGTNPSSSPIVDWAPGGPAVTINQAPGQADPTGSSLINFAVVFSAAVTGFTGNDVTITGTAGGTKTASVAGSGTTYMVAVSGMTTVGTVVATVPADIALTTPSTNPADPLDDESARPNLASTSTDNTVTWSPVAAAITLTTTAPIPPGAKDPVILWGQGFTLGVQFGAGGANRTFELQGTRDGAAWTTITSLTTNATGEASLVYRPVTNLFYRAVFAGAPDLAAATSNEVRTVVRQLAVMRPTNGGSVKTVSRDSAITFSTTVRPARPELPPSTVSFFLYKQVAGTWQLATKRDIIATGAGLANTTFTFSSAGQWYVRSQAGPTSYNANSVLTPVERYSVE